MIDHKILVGVGIALLVVMLLRAWHVHGDRARCFSRDVRAAIYACRVYLQRGRRSSLLIWIGSGLSLLGACFLLLSWVFEGAALAIVALPLMAVSFIMSRRRRNRLISLIRQEDHLLCPFCHYSLAGSISSGRCPECGEAFQSHLLVTIWEEAINYNPFFMHTRKVIGSREDE